MIYIENDYTKRLSFLNTEIIDFCGMKITVKIYKTRSKKEARKRFLIWLPDYKFCAIVWKDFTINVSDVGKTANGENWYSYNDCKILSVLKEAPEKLENHENVKKDYDEALKYAFAKIVYEKHEELTVAKSA